MATQQDVWASADRAAAEARIRAIYTNDGVSAPANLSALVDRAVGNPDYFDTIRKHSERDAAASGGGTVTPGTVPTGTGGLIPTPEGGWPTPTGERPFQGGEAGARDFSDIRADQKALYPWLTPALLDIFTEQWVEHGNAQLALAYVRQSSAYEQAFPGIRRPDGTLRMTENEYFSTKVGFTEALAEFGASNVQVDFKGLFEKEVSAQEFYRAIEQGHSKFVEPGSDDTGLFEKFVGTFASTGSAVTALEQVRNSSEWANTFVGNRRDDGTLRMDESDYFAYKRGWQRLFLNRNLNPQPFEGTGAFRKAVENEVSIAELDARLNGVEQGILNNTAETRAFFEQNYGITDLSDLGAGGLNIALGMAIDTTVGKDVLERRITASQIGGEAAVQGFRRSVDRAEELARAGVNQSQARSLYSQAGQRLPGLSATTRRFYRGDTNLTDYEDAFALGDAGQTGRLSRALNEEQSTFTSRRDTRVDQSGGLSGLRQR